MDDERLPERDWRTIWEEVLDEAARRRIKHAMWHGKPLEDPDEAAIAIERAQRLRRGVRWSVLLNILVGVLLIGLAFWLVEFPTTANFWWLVGVYAVIVVLSPLVGWIKRRQLDRAIDANSRHLRHP